jgi:hypothetical protein
MEKLQILKARCDAGLYPDVMPAEILERIAFSGKDLRLCIEQIRHSVLIAESDASKRVEHKHYDKAIESIFSDGKSPDNRPEDLIYSVIKSNGPLESGALFKKLGEEKKAGLSYTTFYRILQKLRKEGHIIIEPLAKERGKTSLIRIK